MSREYPEHEKLRAVSDASQAIGEFIETGGFTLGEFREAGNNGEPRYVWEEGREIDRAPNGNDYLRSHADHNPAYESWRGELIPVGKSLTQILADYFEIDLDKIEHEKRQMLDEMRAMQAGVR
jgi:hypothetical protein